MVRSSIRLTPAQRRDAVASEVAALCATGAQYRRALEILAINWELRRTLLSACFVVGVAFLAAALWSGIDTVYAVSAAAFLAALVGHCIWFQDWS